MTDDAVAPPDPAVFDRARDALAAGGPAAAADRLCDDLRAAGDWPNLFYARLLRTRVGLGVSPFPTGPADDLPADAQAAYEDAIRTAAREVGGALLAAGDIPKAWTYFRLIGEADPVRDAIRAYDPGPDDDVYPVVQVAWQHGVAAEKGFDLVLERHGVCPAITMASSTDFGQNNDLRAYCVGRLVRALHAELADRVRADLTARGSPPPADATLADMTEPLAADLAAGLCHVDASHLASVARLALQLPAGPDVRAAADLCRYAEHLPAEMKGFDDPPFDATFADYRRYLEVVGGVDVAGGLAHFRAKLPAAVAGGYRYPVEVLVDLLVKAGRPAEALAVARDHLGPPDGRPLSCPGVVELGRRVGDYAAVAESARAAGDPVGYLAGLIAGRG